MRNKGKNSGDTKQTTPQAALPKGETLEDLLDAAAGAARDRGRGDLVQTIERLREKLK